MSGCKNDKRSFEVTPSDRGFTLVELLVVIGIIAVLIGILLPALNRARSAAKSVACEANLRSIGQAIYLYGAQNKGSLPPGYFDGVTNVSTDTNGDGSKAYKWPAVLMHTLDPRYGLTFSDSSASGSDTAKLKQMFSCPEVDTFAQSTGGGSLAAGNGLTHYACHPRLMPYCGNDSPKGAINNGGSGFSVQQGYAAPYKISQVRRATEIALIFDASLYLDATTGNFEQQFDMPIAGSLDGGQFQVGTGHTFLLDKFYGVGNTFTPNDSISLAPYNAAPSQSDVNEDVINNSGNIRFRHIKNTTANVLMVDGHVESFKYKPTLTMNDPNLTDLKRKNVNVNLISYRKFP